MNLSLTPNVIPSIKCTLITRLSPCSPAWRAVSFPGVGEEDAHPGHDPAANGSGGGEV